VSNRDQEPRSLAEKVDKIVFGSGHKISHGKVLYNVCKEKNEHTFFVSNPDQIEAGWFVPGDSVGICGATSTPMWLMEQVRERILTF